MQCINKIKINDFYWVTYFSESYSDIVINLIESIFKYSNRKCILYSVNFDYHLPNKFNNNSQFIIKRIDIEEGNIDSGGRDENIISCKPSILFNVIDDFPKEKFVYIDTDCYITANADGVKKYFKDLENYPLVNSHMHDRLYNRGLIDGEEWTSSVDILAKKMGVEISIFPRRKTNIIVFDGNSKWFMEECKEIYNKYKNTEVGIFALHDEDTINVMLSKYKMNKCLPLCDVERTNQISIEESIKNSDFFSPNISQNLILPKHTNDIITFHQLKTQEEFDDVKNNYGNSVIDCDEVLVTYNDNTILFTRNSFLTNKIIDENVDFIIKNLKGDIITRLNNQNLFNSFNFEISNIFLTDGLYIVEIVKTNSKGKIFNSLIKIIAENKMKNRNNIGEYLTSLGLINKGVEVGVFKGEFSKEILSKWGGTLYMVDHWRPLGKEYKDASNHKNHLTAYQDTMEAIQGFEDRAIMIRSSSEQAVNLFEDCSLDFVYLDGNHAYDFIKQDIELWYPKVKKGGIVAGHDYLDMNWNEDPNFLPNGKDKHIYTNTYEGTQFYNGVFGVNPAVDEFCKKYQVKLNLNKEKWFDTWWVIK